MVTIKTISVLFGVLLFIGVLLLLVNPIESFIINPDGTMYECDIELYPDGDIKTFECSSLDSGCNPYFHSMMTLENLEDITTVLGFKTNKVDSGFKYNLIAGKSMVLSVLYLGETTEKICVPKQEDSLTLYVKKIIGIGYTRTHDSKTITKEVN